MRVSVPGPELDRPPLASAAAVAVVSLAVGLGIARSTVRPAPPLAEAPGAALAASVVDPAAPEPPSSELADAGPGDVTPEPEAPSAIPDAGAGAPLDAAAPDAPPPAGAAGEGAPPPPDVSRRDRGTLARGRVAYLRCEGGASGAACARDAAVEAAVWSAIDALPACATGPASPGQADVVVELSAGTVEVRARDTFAADVVRLDAAATVACLAPLSSEAALTGSGRRLVLSFRFRLD